MPEKLLHGGKLLHITLSMLSEVQASRLVISPDSGKLQFFADASSVAYEAYVLLYSHEVGGRRALSSSCRSVALSLHHFIARLELSATIFSNATLQERRSIAEDHLYRLFLIRFQYHAFRCMLLHLAGRHLSLLEYLSSKTFRNPNVHRTLC